MSEKILVPIDESEPSTDALRFALEQYSDAEITALHVINPGDFASATGIEAAAASYQDLLDNYEQRAERLLEEARDTADEMGVDIETDTVIGRIARSIVEYVEDNDIDHVVIGSHGRKGATRVLLGSVAEKVTRRSPVPVTVVR